MASTYQIVDLSTIVRETNHVESITLVSKFRAFRLDALRSSPEAFASTYETEAQRDMDQSRQRLINPSAAHLIAVKPQSSALPLDGQEWLGMIVLLGPEDEASSVTVSAKSDPFARMTHRPSDYESEPDTKLSRSWHYHLNGVFVRSTARKAGLGNALIQAALGIAKNRAHRAGVRSLKFTISVDSENQAAQHLYGTAGFRATGSEKYMQQPRALVQGESALKERVAVHMELELDVSEAPIGKTEH